MDEQKSMRVKYIGLVCGLAFGLLLGILMGLSHALPAQASAHESLAALLFLEPSTGATFVVANTNNFGPGSLRRAINDANANPGADAIVIAIPACSLRTPCVISPATQLPEITDTLTISGMGSTSLVIDANHAFQGLRIDSVPVTITDLTIQNGDTLSFGGGIYSSGPVTLLRTRLLNNHAGFMGGGIYAGLGLLVRDGYFENNRSDQYGGGLATGNWVNLTNTEFFSNTADFGGGASNLGDTRVSGGVFTRNASSYYGGGLYAGSLILTGTVFISNTAGVSGGGLVTTINDAVIHEARFEQNSTLDNGGGLLATAPITLTNTTFISNTALDSGGGLYAMDRLSISLSWFEANQAQSGGGLAALDLAAITQTSFIDNIASLGGGGLHVSNQWKVVSSIFEANQAILGGGILDDHGTGAAVNSLFSRNEAQSGSALYLVEANTLILHSTLAGGPGSGSGIYIDSAGPGALALENSILAYHDIGINHMGGALIQDYNLFFENGADIQGGYTGGGNNISGNPRFLNPAAQEYHLTRGSAAIDSGFDSGIPVDFEEEERPLGGGVDIGFDEANLIEGLMISYIPNPTISVQTPVTFTASIASGAPASFNWDFGDGSPQQAGNPLTHSYLLSGVYTVAVTATNLIDSSFANAVLEVQLAEGNKLYLPLVVR